MTAVDLDTIRARAAAATPGPWHADPDQVTVCTSDGRSLVHLADVLLADDDTRDQHPQATADAAFIAAAREDVPALLAEIDRLVARIEAAGAAYTDFLRTACDEDGKVTLADLKPLFDALYPKWSAPLSEGVTR